MPDYTVAILTSTITEMTFSADNAEQAAEQAKASMEPNAPSVAFRDEIKVVSHMHQAYQVNLALEPRALRCEYCKFSRIVDGKCSSKCISSVNALATDEELQEWCANASATYNGALGHGKADRNAEQSQRWANVLKERGIEFDRREGVFNGKGSC